MPRPLPEGILRGWWSGSRGTPAPPQCKPPAALLNFVQQILPENVGPLYQFQRRTQVFSLRFLRLLDECPDPFHRFLLRLIQRFARCLLQCPAGARETLGVRGFVLAALIVREDLAEL